MSGDRYQSLLLEVNRCQTLPGQSPRFLIIDHACQASKTAFRSRCARPGGTLHERGVLSEYPAARARASYWFDNDHASGKPAPLRIVRHGNEAAVAIFNYESEGENGPQRQASGTLKSCQTRRGCCRPTT